MQVGCLELPLQHLEQSNPSPRRASLVALVTTGRECPAMLLRDPPTVVRLPVRTG